MSRASSKISPRRYRDPSSYDTFAEIATQVETLPNNGKIKHQEMTIGNSCFFISLAQATGKDPYQLLTASEYENWGHIIDDNNKEHRKCMQRLVNILKLNVEIYSGQQNGRGIWLINPDYVGEVRCSSQQSVKTIRVVTNGSHFEYITSLFDQDEEDDYAVEETKESPSDADDEDPIDIKEDEDQHTLKPEPRRLVSESYDKVSQSKLVSRPKEEEQRRLVSESYDKVSQSKLMSRPKEEEQRRLVSGSYDKVSQPKLMSRPKEEEQRRLVGESPDKALKLELTPKPKTEITSSAPVVRAYLKIPRYPSSFVRQPQLPLASGKRAVCGCSSSSRDERGTVPAKPQSPKASSSDKPKDFFALHIFRR